MPGVAAAAGLFGLLIFVFVRGRAVFPQTFQKLPEESNTQQIGEWLYSYAPSTPHPTYILPFEIASLLLLIAASFASNHIAARIAFDHGLNVVTAC